MGWICDVADNTGLSFYLRLFSRCWLPNLRNPAKFWENSSDGQTDKETGDSIGCVASEEVILHLISSKCLPILLYGLESLPLYQYQLNSLDFVINRFFMKLFRTTDMYRYFAGNVWFWATECSHCSSYCQNLSVSLLNVTACLVKVISN